MLSRTVWMTSLCGGLCLLTVFAAVVQPRTKQAKTGAGAITGAAGKSADSAAKSLPRKIDLSAARTVNLPDVQDLKMAAFTTSDGKTGWVLRLPGRRPIATPAYADGMLFVGGGYGSHEFYAVDADSGKIIWRIQTGDDGPTAAVVADGMVAFNTESCTLVVVDERRGRVVWQEWLGDPLMSQPAIDKGVLYMGHPAAT